LRLIYWAFALFLGLSTLAMAEPRIALVIGNGGYVAVGSLPNPPNDARLVAGTLEKLGFKVTLVADGTMDQMSSAVTEFGSALRKAGPETTGLFYYAGHGVQSFGINYLVPVDAKLSNAADLGLVALDAQTVLRQMFSARNRTNIVILDACRNNPFVNVRDLGDNGLAEMSAPTGTFLAYATSPRAVALDGLDGNSPFTKALVEKIVTPGLPIEQVFKEVRVAVLEETQGRQTPWDTSSLTNDFTFAAAGAAGDEAALWTSVLASRDAVQVMLFLRAYPNSAHDAEARKLLAEVMAAEVAPKPEVTAPDPTDPAEAAAYKAAEALGTIEAFEAFMTVYPESIFVDAATAEIEILNSAPRGSDPALVAELDGMIDEGLSEKIAAENVAFKTPLKIGTSSVIGKSIEELVETGTPLFSPIEGLPKEAWAGQPCAACHQWTEAALCDQGKFYVKEANPEVSLTQHPLGGEFKLTLKAWAAGGCK